MDEGCKCIKHRKGKNSTPLGYIVNKYTIFKPIVFNPIITSFFPQGSKLLYIGLSRWIFFIISVFSMYVSAYIYSEHLEVIQLIHIYGKDYIKYLNDESSGRITFDQWKNKNGNQDTDKCHYCGKSKNHFQPCPKCKF